MNTSIATMLGAFGIGGWEAVVILGAFLLLFGSKKLPELARGLGQGIREFKKATREVTDEIQNAASDAPPPPAAPRQLPPTQQPTQTVSQSSPPKA
jgi:sec-independent protein translocase protein TatA